jgi:hypothetical protein
MAQWKATTGKQSNALNGSEGQPIISQGGPDDRYVGRVVIEMWRGADGQTTLAYMSDLGPSSSMSHRQLLDAVSVEFPARVKVDRPLMQQE